MAARIPDQGDLVDLRAGVFRIAPNQERVGIACLKCENESDAQEVVQETVISVAKAMQKFRYDPARGSFKGWLLQLAGWRITNQFLRRKLL